MLKNYYSVSVSFTTIPIRFRNGHLKLFIDSILNQTYKINNIYINIANDYKRFKNFNDDELKIIKGWSNKIIITKNEFDSPVLKYLGCVEACSNNDELIFIGDDDQEYKEDLIYNMVSGINNLDYVYQNRFNIVRTGTAGIIHGFVGLMMKKKLLNNLINYKIKDSYRWIDDQFMTYYFNNENIKIKPSLIHDFEDIYKTLNEQGMEKLGSGGDLCLSEETKKRNDFIRSLEDDRNIFFRKKNRQDSKGEIYKFKKNEVINFNLIGDEKNKNIIRILNRYSNHKHVKINIFTLEHLKDVYKYNIDKSLEYEKEYLINKFGIEITKKEEFKGLYISNNLTLEDNIDLIDFYIDMKNKECRFKNGIMIYKYIKD